MKERLIICLVLLGSLIAAGYLLTEHRQQGSEVRAEFLRKENARLDAMVSRVESTFTQIYQGARTLSLIPSIRRLTGGNIPEENEGALDESRFDEDGQMTVQQLYNNLASNISVSEIYAVMKGFRPSEGETPFFMYDALLLNDSAEESSGEAEVHNPDQPEDYEGAEYEHYVKQLGYFEANYPRFSYEALNEIPMIASPSMRTCDNTQYQSVARHDEKDSFGILFSVPFYHDSSTFQGIISVIVRNNIFEALLIDRPFVVVTEEDQETARRQGWQMPETPGRFLLKNDQHGIEIFDRRNPALANHITEKAAQGLSLSREIATPMVSSWKLAYLLDEESLNAQLAALKGGLWTKLFLLVAVSALISYGCFNAQRKARMRRQEHENELRHAEEQTRKHNELEEISASMKGILQNVALTSEELGNHSSSLELSSASLSRSAREQTDSLRLVNGHIDTFLSQVNMNAQSTKQAQEISELARRDAERGDTRMASMLEAMSDISSASDQIAKIIKTIDEIAFQTNLLALNAAVEAARAGQHGKGFAVVAEEVRNLAARSAKAAHETTELIESSIAKVNSGVEIAEETAQALQEILKRNRQICEIIDEVSSVSALQSDGIREISQSLAQIESVTGKNSQDAQEGALAAEQLSQQAQRLKKILEGSGQKQLT